MARRRKNSSVTIAREDLAAVNGHGGSANGGAGGAGQINIALVRSMRKIRAVLFLVSREAARTACTRGLAWTAQQSTVD